MDGALLCESYFSHFLIAFSSQVPVGETFFSRQAPNVYLLKCFLSGRGRGSRLVLLTLFPEQNGHPCPLLLFAILTIHSWSSPIGHFHQTFLPDLKVKSCGFKSLFFVGWNSYENGRKLVGSLTWETVGSAGRIRVGPQQAQDLWVEFSTKSWLDRWSLQCHCLTTPYRSSRNPSQCDWERRAGKD